MFVEHFVPDNCLVVLYMLVILEVEVCACDLFIMLVDGLVMNLGLLAAIVYAVGVGRRGFFCCLEVHTGFIWWLCRHLAAVHCKGWLVKYCVCCSMCF